MKISGETVIAADQQTVWRGLNDPEVLRRSIPGCESLEKTGENAFRATVVTRIGPVSAKFEGRVQLTDLDPPNGYTLNGSGSAGPMGAAKGAARVTLTPHPDGTQLSYDVDADLSGKIAQLGARLVQSAAGVIAGQFFTRFGAIVAGEEGAPERAATGGGPRTASGVSPTAAIIAIALFALAAALFFLW